jgi:DHA3 family macrolide efflux protein-like MFS transporter
VDAVLYMARDKRHVAPSATSHHEAGLAVDRPTKLFNRNFFLLFQGQSVSNLGMQAFTVAMVFWIKHATDSATLMGVILMVSSLPAVLLGPVAGAFADRYSRRAIIVLSDLVRGLAVLALAVFMFIAPGATGAIIPWLFGVSVVSAIISAFFSPAVSAAIPDLVPKEKITAANSLGRISYQIAMFLGQGMGGTLFRVVGAPGLFLLNGITYLFSGISELFIRIPQPIREKTASTREQINIFRRDLVEGFRYVWNQEGLRQTVLLSCLLTFFSTPVLILLPFFVENTLGVTPDWYGFLLASYGLGSMLGFLVAGALGLSSRQRGLWMIAFIIVDAAAYGLLGLAGTPVVAVVIAAVGGLTEAFVMVHITTLVQIATPTLMRGRVFGLLGSLSGSLAPIAMGLSGIIADLLNQNIPLIYLGCGTAMVILSLALIARRSFREFLSQDESGEGYGLMTEALYPGSESYLGSDL